LGTPALQQQDQPGDEVRHHVLQTDSHADAERAGQDRDPVATCSARWAI